jgi:hypothetical protein
MLLPSFTAPKFRAFVGEEYGLTNTFTVGDALTSKYFEKPVELSFGSTARFLISNIKSFVPNLLRVRGCSMELMGSKQRNGLFSRN